MHLVYNIVTPQILHTNFNMTITSRHFTSLHFTTHKYPSQYCNRLCLLLRSAMATIDTLIRVRGSYLREYSGINSTVCKVVLNNKLYFSFLGLQCLPTGHNSTKLASPAKCTRRVSRLSILS